MTTARRTLAGQLEQAISRLQGENEHDLRVVLHGVRVDLKKSRSLLRLMRPALSVELYGREMDALRQSARAISAARDADVLPATMRRLRARYFGYVSQGTYDVLKERLAQGVHEGAAQAALAGQIELLREARQRVDAWSLRELRWADILDEFRCTYQRGRKAFGRAQRQPSVENLHEWRKRTKDLQYQLRLLRAAWPTVLAAYVQQAHRLADLLGDDHDLAVLISVISDSAEAAGQVPTADSVIELAERRRLELQTKAWLLGQRLYGESPKELRRRMKRLVQTARP
jgi:CHAD domain-containing protein